MSKEETKGDGGLSLGRSISNIFGVVAKPLGMGWSSGSDNDAAPDGQNRLRLKPLFRSKGNINLTGVIIGKSHTHRHPNQIGGYDFELKHNSEYDRWLQKYIRTSLAPQQKRWNEVKGSRTSYDSMKPLVRYGLPAESRGEVWLRLGSGWTPAGSIDQMNGAYWKMLTSKQVLSSDAEPLESNVSIMEALSTAPSLKPLPALESKVRKAIVKDLDRTFTNHPVFRTSKGRKALKHCLSAYARHNPRVGYCQSMNFIAGYLLLFYPPRQAFLMLVAICDYYLPKDYFSSTMLSVNVDAYVLADKLKSINRQLWTHVLVTHRIDLSMIVVPWFCCLFIKTLPIETCLRVWDVFFFEGSKSLFRIGLALFTIHAQEILKITDAGLMFNFLSTMGNDLYDCDMLMKVAFSLPAMNRSTLSKQRGVYTKVLASQFDSIVAEREAARVEDSYEPTPLAAPSSASVHSPPSKSPTPELEVKSNNRRNSSDNPTPPHRNSRPKRNKKGRQQQQDKPYDSSYSHTYSVKNATNNGSYDSRATDEKKQKKKKKDKKKKSRDKRPKTGGARVTSMEDLLG